MHVEGQVIREVVHAGSGLKVVDVDDARHPTIPEQDVAAVAIAM